jgi:hypothetical protein
MRTSPRALPFALAPVVTWAAATSPDAADLVKLGDITVTGSLRMFGIGSSRRPTRMIFSTAAAFIPGRSDTQGASGYLKDKDGPFGYVELLYKF